MYQYLPKAEKAVKSLTEIKSTNLNGVEGAMIATLQGLIADKTENRIFINCKRTDWSLQDLKENHGVCVTEETNPWALVETYKSYIKGYILYESDCPDYNPDAELDYNPDADPSINVANTVAPFYEAIIVDKSIEEKAKAAGLTMLLDVTGKTTEWVYQEYWDRLNHDIVVEAYPQLKMFMRDYAYMAKALIFHAKAEEDPIREQILSTMNTNGVLMGWSAAEEGEIGFIREASKNGIATIPCDWSANLSVFSAFPSVPAKQRVRNKVESEENVHYVCILMSDGDNEQWVLNDLMTDRKWFNNDYKGKFDMAYAMPPYLYDHAPTLLEKLYRDAANEPTGQDQFIVGPSGCAYMYPSFYPEEKLDAHLDLLNDYMGKTDTHVIAVIDHEAMDRTDIWDKYTAKENIHGLIYLEYYFHPRHAGTLYFSNGKPVISCSDMLWVDLTKDEEVIAKVNAGSRDITSKDAYSLVYIHAWSKDMDDVAKMVSQFKEDVRIVNAEQFMELITKNVKH